MAEEKRPLRNWEGVVERQIRQAIERGEFRGQAGKGKRLDLEGNPFTPADWRLAYKLLQDAGIAPEWIEQDKAIRREIDALARMLEQNAKRERERRSRLGALAPDRLIAEYEEIGRSHEQVCQRFREKATGLNREIDDFNLQAPSSRLHHPRIRIEEVLSKFRSACLVKTED